MTRYIDADELYETVTKKYSDIVAGCYPYNIVAYDMARLVKEAPTEDVVPKSEVVDLISEIDAMIELVSAMTGIDIIAFGKYAELKKKYTGGFHEQNEV